MKPQIILVDVSHIVGWRGNLTGIERVEYQLIKYYYKNTDANFVCWDNENVCFRIASRKFVKRTIINRTSETEQQSLGGLPGISVLKKIRHKLKLVAKTVSAPIPEGEMIILAGLWDNQAYIDGIKKLSANHTLIHVVYDMIPLIHKEYVVDFLPLVFGKYMHQTLPICKAIMAISKSTAKDTKRVLRGQNLNVPKIFSFRLGDDITRAKEIVKPKGIEGDFILSAGTIEARKNHQLLYDAYKQLIATEPTAPKLIIAGKRGWLTSDFQLKVDNNPDTKGRVIILDKTTDSELRWLYENCLYTIFPSFYEGWGLPVAESLNYGKVTLSSDTSSMPEVGGECVDYFSPYSTGELLKLMRHYQNKEALDKRSFYIKKNYKPVSWDKTSAEFAKLANKVYKVSNSERLSENS